MRYLFYLIMTFCTSCNSDKNDLLGNDYRLFEDTPVWELAKAVKNQDVVEIKQIIQKEKPNIDYQESKYGSTLLMLTVMNQHYNSCKTLLEFGASPNIHDTYSGSSAIINAAAIQNRNDDNTSFLKLLLSYGGDPNDEETGERKNDNATRKTPLLVACSDVIESVSPIEKVKLLVENGANINYKNEYNDFALREALLHDHYDVVLYLLANNANYNEILFDRSQFGDGGKEINIINYLREQLFPLNSKEYQEKMLVVNFLEEKGIDYRNIPIPDYVLKEAKRMYPDNWKEYLKVY